MIIDGKSIRASLKQELIDAIQAKEERPHLTIVYVGENPVIDTYVSLKESFGNDIGAHVLVERFLGDISQNDLIEAMSVLGNSKTDGMIVQLPLPDHIETYSVLNCIPDSKDIDVLSKSAFDTFKNGGHILPPVVGAVDEIFRKHAVDLLGKRVVVIGRGRLVGLPLEFWLKNQGVTPVVLEKGDDIETHTQNADIIISGAGSPELIKPDMIQEGVVLVDAGTSDVGGATVGDISLSCEEKASLFAPVPGGVGPITVAKLFENLLTCMR